MSTLKRMPTNFGMDFFLLLFFIWFGAALLVVFFSFRDQLANSLSEIGLQFFFELQKEWNYAHTHMHTSHNQSPTNIEIPLGGYVCDRARVCVPMCV